MACALVVIGLVDDPDRGRSAVLRAATMGETTSTPKAEARAARASGLGEDGQGRDAS